MSEDFCQQGCLGGKPATLSPIDGERSGVRIFDDSTVYNRPVPTPRHPPIRLSLFPLSHLSNTRLDNTPCLQKITSRSIAPSHVVASR